MQQILDRYSLRRQEVDANGKQVYAEMSLEEQRMAAEEFLAHLQETNGVPTGEIYADHKAEIDQFARERGMDAHDQSARNIDRMTREWMAQTGFRPERPGWLKQLISRIRLWLNRHGFFVHHLTDDDILTILARSARAEVAQRRGGGAQENGVRFAIGQPPQGNQRPYYQVPFAEGVKNAIDPAQKNTFRSPIFVRQTPEPFLQIGFPALPMMTNVRKARLNYYTESEFVKYFGSLRPDENAHGLHDNLLKVEEALAHPVAIMANLAPSAQPGSVMAITDININGKKVVVPVVIATQSMADNSKIDAHLVLTVYDKNDWMERIVKPALKAEKNGIGIFYLDKQKAEKYAVFSQLKERTLSGVIHNINDPNSPVKGFFKKQTETLQFQRWFKNSKVVDADGKPLIVYHGSPAEFTVFSYLFGPRNGSAEGRGFYFTGDKAKAEGYKGANGKLYEVYLRLRKPLDPDALTITKAEVEKIIRAIDPDGDYVSDYASDSSGYPGRAWYEKAVKDAANAIYDSSDNNADIIGEFFSVFGQGDALKKITEATGYDGFIKKDTYVVFAPEQIKSATDNVGTFDPNNPDVRYSIDDDGAGFVEPVPFVSSIDDSRGKNIVAMLRPIVGRNQSGFDKEALARNIKERYGVDVTPVEALLWAREAARQNYVEEMRRQRKVRDEWLYNNNLLWKQAVDYAGSENFKVRVSERMNDRELSGTFWLKKGEKYTGTVIDLDALANEVARQQSRDALDVEQEFFEFFNGLDKPKLFHQYTEFRQQELAGDKEQARRDKEEWMQQEKFRIEDEVVRIIEAGQPVTEEWAKVPPPGGCRRRYAGPGAWCGRLCALRRGSAGRRRGRPG